MADELLIKLQEFFPYNLLHKHDICFWTWPWGHVWRGAGSIHNHERFWECKMCGKLKFKMSGDLYGFYVWPEENQL